MKKLMKDLKPGDIFLDNFDIPLKVVSIQILDGVINQRVRMVFDTPKNNRMRQVHLANREVLVVNKG